MRKAVVFTEKTLTGATAMKRLRMIHMAHEHLQHFASALRNANGGRRW